MLTNLEGQVKDRVTDEREKQRRTLSKVLQVPAEIQPGRQQHQVLVEQQRPQLEPVRREQQAKTKEPMRRQPVNNNLNYQPPRQFPILKVFVIVDVYRTRMIDSR